MVQNSFELDVKGKCIEYGNTQAQTAKKIGMIKFYVNRIIRKEDAAVDKTLIQTMKRLGYDVKLTYIKYVQDINDGEEK